MLHVNGQILKKQDELTLAIGRRVKQLLKLHMRQPFVAMRFWDIQ
jgi:hypothetical protein